MFAAKRLGKVDKQHPSVIARNQLTDDFEQELQKAKQHLPPGIELVKADDFQEWQMDIKVLDENPLYMNQTFRLCFKFGPNYPIEAPEVTFLNLSPSSSLNMTSPSSTASSSSSTTTPQQTARPIPMHPHVYSNGIICLDLLGTAGWSPVQSVESVCMSIQSMLTGNTKNERPPGDEDFCRRNRSRPKDIRFVYEDNSV